MSKLRVLHVSMGKAGSGKTFDLALRLRLRLHQLGERGSWPVVFIHDQKLRIGDGWQRHALGALAPVAGRLKRPADLPGDHYPTRVMAFYECEAEEVCQLAWAHARSTGAGAVLVVDELDRLPPKLNIEHPAYRAIHHGRQYMLDVFGTTRRPSQVDKAFFSEATSVALFRMEGNLDLKVITQCGWSQADRLAAAVPQLADRQHLMAVQEE